MPKGCRHLASFSLKEVSCSSASHFLICLIVSTEGHSEFLAEKKGSSTSARERDGRWVLPRRSLALLPFGVRGLGPEMVLVDGIPCWQKFTLKLESFFLDLPHFEDKRRYKRPKVGCFRAFLLSL